MASPVLKVLVVGDPATGKTSLIQRYVHNVFTGNYKTTIGVDFQLKILNLDGKNVRLQLWDVAGQERLGGISRVFCKDAVGALVCFDISRRSTLDSCSRWKTDIDGKVRLPDESVLPMALLANKCDLLGTEGCVEEAVISDFAKKNGFIGSFQTSAKEDINIERAVAALVKEILQHNISKPTARHSQAEDVVSVRGGSVSAANKNAGGGCC
eukprot:GILK01001844.1.p1 GENE.GILK01001844.1~~GILK01001844.1.p1  ORF type:complete len:211 (-),score=36.77 GILK01001844.1:195-827(-)